MESVAGPGATHLTFSRFAQIMHGAMSSSKQQEGEQPWQQQGGASARGGASSRVASGAAGGKTEQELSWNDFHLLAKAFR